MSRFPLHRLSLSAYDPSLVELAGEVGRQVHQYGEDDTLAIVEWLVEAGNAMQGKPVGWIASAYQAGHLHGRPGCAR